MSSLFEQNNSTGMSRTFDTLHSCVRKIPTNNKDKHIMFQYVLHYLIATKWGRLYPLTTVQYIGNDDGQYYQLYC